MLAKLLSWLWSDLCQHHTPYALIAITFVLGVGYTNYYSTPAHEFAGLQQDVGVILETMQQEKVDVIKLRVQELEYKDQHNNGDELPKYEKDELFNKRNQLPGEEDKLRGIKARNKELGKSHTVRKKLPAFSLQRNFLELIA